MQVHMYIKNVHRLVSGVDLKQIKHAQLNLQPAKISCSM